jgi:uncharacterized protein with HEPN domain
MAASRNPLVRLGHIRDEITDLEEAMKGASIENFANNYVLRRTSEHAILIISEAVKSLSAEFTDHYEGIDWRAIRDIGNILRHDYFEVDPKVIWRIVTDRLRKLKIVIEQMIKDHS